MAFLAAKAMVCMIISFTGLKLSTNINLTEKLDTHVNILIFALVIVGLYKYTFIRTSRYFTLF